MLKNKFILYGRLCVIFRELPEARRLVLSVSPGMSVLQLNKYIYICIKSLADNNWHPDEGSEHTIQSFVSGS